MGYNAVGVHPPLTHGKMTSLFTRLLVLACSTLLALPPGWCCLAFCHAPARTARPDAEPLASCCKHKTTPASPHQAPEPLPPEECPCADRHTTAPDQRPSVLPDVSLPAFLIPITSAPDLGVTSQLDAVGNVPFPFAEPPPQLLYCLWLC
jgi:hypothetical protein